MIILFVGVFLGDFLGDFFGDFFGDFLGAFFGNLNLSAVHKVCALLVSQADTKAINRFDVRRSLSVGFDSWTR